MTRLLYRNVPRNIALVFQPFRGNLALKSVRKARDSEVKASMTGQGVAGDSGFWADDINPALP